MPKVYLTQEDREQARVERAAAVVADWLRYSRLRTGRQDQETAELIGVDRATFCRWKRHGVDKITFDIFVKIYIYCGATAEDLAHLAKIMDR